MRRIAFVNEKGGTCKTTLCVNTAAWIAARRGKRVLVADLDTQGHAGKALGVDVRGLSPTIRDVLVGGERAVRDVVRATGVPGLDLLPANKDLAGFPVEVAAFPDRAERLRRCLDAIPEGAWDAVLLDAPPSVSLVTENVLRAATVEERFPGRRARRLGYAVKIAAAQSHGRTICEYAPRSSGAAAFAEIA